MKPFAILFAMAVVVQLLGGFHAALIIAWIICIMLFSMFLLGHLGKKVPWPAHQLILRGAVNGISPREVITRGMYTTAIMMFIIPSFFFLK
jgi:hypothetical protein